MKALTSSLSPTRLLGFALVMAVVWLSGCASVEDSAPLAADPTRTVTCLLPSQVRPLDSNTEYLAARRSIETTAGECETRGGEIVTTAAQ